MADVIINNTEYTNIDTVILKSSKNGSAVYNEKTGFYKIDNRKKCFPKSCISFIDDDCRSEVYSILYPFIQEKNIPYALACPPNSIGKENYMTLDELNEVKEAFTIVSHHWNQESMNDFTSESNYQENLNKCTEFFENNNIPVEMVAYPNGITNLNVINSAIRTYECGFTVDRGINTIPINSFFLKRIECFPTNSMYDIERLKKYVDKCANNGGWIIFMTHCWYSTFSTSVLSQLIDYINAQNIDILSINDAYKIYSNIIDTGLNLPLKNNAKDSFTLIDALGNIATNSLTNINKVDYNLRNTNIGYNIGYNLSSTGKLVSTSDKMRLVSESWVVAENEKYILTGNNIYGSSIYAIYDSSGNVIEKEQSENTANGSELLNKEITIPENGATLRIACNLNVYDYIFTLYKEV